MNLRQEFTSRAVEGHPPSTETIAATSQGNRTPTRFDDVIRSAIRAIRGPDSDRPRRTTGVPDKTCVRWGEGRKYPARRSQNSNYPNPVEPTTISRSFSCCPRRNLGNFAQKTALDAMPPPGGVSKRPSVGSPRCLSGGVCRHAPSFFLRGTVEGVARMATTSMTLSRLWRQLSAFGQPRFTETLVNRIFVRIWLSSTRWSRTGRKEPQQMTRLMKVIIAVFSTAIMFTANAAVPPQGMVVEVQSSTKAQSKEITKKRSDGRHDSSQSVFAELIVKHRCIGLPVPTTIGIEATFIAVDPENGKLTIQSTKREIVKLSSIVTTTVITSDPIEKTIKHVTEGLTRTKDSSGLKPTGWILSFVENGRIFLTKESSSGLAAKVAKLSPPPTKRK